MHLRPKSTKIDHALARKIKAIHIEPLNMIVTPKQSNGQAMMKEKAHRQASHYREELEALNKAYVEIEQKLKKVETDLMN
ncbi:unnamed protein product [Sphenostylis stenocarpa]|uniref:Uncharacterized protein n=1 Tax=Sphenostylis stenocarpa TaxID=92480 RepID=A0AA86SF00_9FABA|nr:unnamed protein product [Sphenostylis stenocarpa]